MPHPLGEYPNCDQCDKRKLILKELLNLSIWAHGILFCLNQTKYAPTQCQELVDKLSKAIKKAQEGL